MASIPINLNIWSIIIGVLGALVLLLNNLFTGWHQKTLTNPWTKRYWWQGRRPFYKNTQTLKWHFKWTRIVIVEGFIPPKYFWEIVGFLLILAGAIFQIIEFL